jgi:hypothetical protein
MRILLSVLLLAPLAAACTTDPAPFVDDPRAEACRARAAAATGTLPGEVEAAYLGTDIEGLASYAVEARTQAYRCSVDPRGRIVGLSRV